jgi:hypothetical protein
MCLKIKNRPILEGCVICVMLIGHKDNKKRGIFLCPLMIDFAWFILIGISQSVLSLIVLLL